MRRFLSLSYWFIVLHGCRAVSCGDYATVYANSTTCSFRVVTIKSGSSRGARPRCSSIRMGTITPVIWYHHNGKQLKPRKVGPSRVDTTNGSSVHLGTLCTLLCIYSIAEHSAVGR
ncbi:hypothetical protein EDB81DRAFT_226293 [Dactylonectria macrodidyma]|uniref:Secreted protein n=1 Tax=Dactylonectria macrodidyma TaxID=307937 RepID=A0A9P9DR71_9HYPO|nr:hypothetical protein EDB81DRAFT_226293 [Dactylonectria macrodidyma]